MKNEDRAELEQDKLPCSHEGTDACDYCRITCPNHEVVDDKPKGK